MKTTAELPPQGARPILALLAERGGEQRAAERKQNPMSKITDLMKNRGMSYTEAVRELRHPSAADAWALWKTSKITMSP